MFVSSQVQAALHLGQALSIEPDLHETRFELAAAYSKAGANDEALKALMGGNDEAFLATAVPAALKDVRGR